MREKEEWKPKVRPRKGGPYSLYCSGCRSWVPSTANSEMKNEGYYAHSHHCGFDRYGKKYEL